MFYLAKSWKERGLQIQAVKNKCNHILEKLALPNDDARAESIIHVRQFCNTLAAVPIKLQQNAEIKRNVLEAIPKPHLVCKWLFCRLDIVSLHRHSYNYACFGFLARRQKFSFSSSKQVLG